MARLTSDKFSHISIFPFSQVQLSEIWKKKYEEWLEVEVFSNPHDWDKILLSPGAFMEVKAMEF